MKFNRDVYLMIGLVLLFLGIQFRLVDTYVLNEKTANYLQEKMSQRQMASASAIPAALMSVNPFPSDAGKKWQPPRWIGWSLLSIGGVCVLHSLILKKPA